MNPVMCHLQNPPFWFGVYPHPAFIGANTAHTALGLGLSMGVAAPPSPSVRISFSPFLGGQNIRTRTFRIYIHRRPGQKWCTRKCRICDFARRCQWQRPAGSVVMAE